jgi:hypothetical protein
MTPPKYAIDVFAPFMGVLTIRGWVAASKDALLELRLEGQVWPIRSFGQPSPDVAEVVPAATHCRFNEQISIGPLSGVVHRATLFVRDGDETFEFNDLASVIDPARHLEAVFAAELRERPPGVLLELGSRARSGRDNNRYVPSGWDYLGLDIHAGPNVDVVGDAHELSALVPSNHFDAVMSFSVLEHLLMPWKVAIELNRVMKDGALGLCSTHQAWPVHDAPWDFWRFSKDAWAGLFNGATGFEIVDVQVGEPGYVVAQRCHAATNFGEQPAYLSSVVMFRKVSETRLNWDVSLNEVLETAYPKGETLFVR